MQTLIKPLVSFALCAAPLRIQGDGEVEILNFDYTKNERTTVRLPMETGESDEKMSATIRRLIGEFAKESEPFSISFFLDTPINPVGKKDKDDPEGLHLQETFLASSVSIQGKLRDCIKVEKQADGDEILGIPRWTDAGKLLRQMEEVRSPWYHHVTVRQVIRTLCGNPAIALRYMDMFTQDEDPRTPKVELQRVLEFNRKKGLL